MQNLDIVILAAGQGTRMCSDVPKVLHTIGNKPMLQNVLETAKLLNPQRIIIVYGSGGDKVQQQINTIFPENDFLWIHQAEQLGTGHALQCCAASLSKTGRTLLLYGDVPLITSQTLQLMLQRAQNNIVVLTATLNNPFGYGRIMRNDNNAIIAIVEEKDATDNQKNITEVNTGFYVFNNELLLGLLSKLTNNNSQQEYYITDLIQLAHIEHIKIDAINTFQHDQVFGVNNKSQLADLERVWQRQMADKLLLSGVTIVDKNRIDIRGTLTAGKNCTIDINCIFIGKVTLGNNVSIAAHSILNNVDVGDDVQIKPYSLIEDSHIGNDTKIGPFARIRPGCDIHDHAHIGNFVEIKNSTIGQKSKVNHLSYVGDTSVGMNVNIGAGSITCNYDGKNKHKTIIENDVFVGSGSMLVAPVTLGSGSVIGAGSTITHNTPANELTIARNKQRTILGWLKRKK